MADKFKFKDGDIVAIVTPNLPDIIGTICGVQTLYENVNLWAVYIHDEYLDVIKEANNGFSVMMVVEPMIVRVDENY